MNDSQPIKTASSFLPSLNFGNGLIEIAALTTLIGSTTAGDLILGNRGAAGIVWGSISAFGSSSVIKACASAASPGWLRQMLGLRTTSSDGTVGMDLSLDRRKNVAKRMRGTLDVPLGVCSLSSDSDHSPAGKLSSFKAPDSYRDVYAFDSTTAVMLTELSSTPVSEPLVIHTHYDYAFYRAHHLHFQVLVLALSLLKALEIYTLLLQGGIVVGFLSGIPFLFSFLSGIVLEVHDIFTSRRPVEVDGHLDLVAASPLPSTKRLGGPKKVILGASRNPRTGLWWRLFWLATLTIQTLSIVLSYFLLGQQEAVFVLTWAGFQLFWVVLRILIFNLSDGSHPMADRPMKPNKLESLPESMRPRVANLVMAVGQYQTHVHPRSVNAYMDDCFDAESARKWLSRPNLSEVYMLPPPVYDSQPQSGPTPHSLTSLSYASSTSSSSASSSAPSFSSSSTSLRSVSTITSNYKLPPNNGMTPVQILGVIGDTTLSSAAWMLGGEFSSKLGPMDLYDTCILVFQVGPSLSPSPFHRYPPNPQVRNIILAVPAARVFSSRSPWFAVMRNQSQDGEQGSEPLFVPKGAGSKLETDEKTWIYWVPCNNGEWLQIKPGSRGPQDHVGPSADSEVGGRPHDPTGKLRRWKRPESNAKTKVQSVLGMQMAEVLDDAQLTRLLGAGNLNIGLRHAGEVRDIVEMSRRGVDVLTKFLR